MDGLMDWYYTHTERCYSDILRYYRGRLLWMIKTHPQQGSAGLKDMKLEYLGL